jgi:hypothetical protein
MDQKPTADLFALLLLVVSPPANLHPAKIDSVKKFNNCQDLQHFTDQVIIG